MFLQVSVTNDADLQFILIEYLATDHSLLVISPCLPAQKTPRVSSSPPNLESAPLIRFALIPVNF